MAVASHNRTHFTNSDSWAPHGTSTIIERAPVSFLRQIYIHRNSSYIIARGHAGDFRLKYLPEMVHRTSRMVELYDNSDAYPPELRKELLDQINYDFLPSLDQISGIYDSPIAFRFANLVVLDIVYIQATYWLLPIINTYPPLRRIIIRDGDDICDSARALPFQEIEDRLAEMPGVKVILLFLSDDICLRKFRDGFVWLYAHHRLLCVTEDDIFGKRTETESLLSLGPVHRDARGVATSDPYAPGLENQYAYKYSPIDDPFGSLNSL